MKFFSYQFPNLSVTGGNVKIKFVDGVYATKIKAEIDVLQGANFPFIEDEVPEPVETPLPKKKASKPKE